MSMTVQYPCNIHFHCSLCTLGFTLIHTKKDNNLQNMVYRFKEGTQPGLTSCSDASKRLMELGLTFTPIEEAIHDTVASLKEKGYLEEQQA